jgi:hypothetical protein
MMPNPEHILVLGPSKTGTTGVYTAVKEGLAKAGIHAKSMFEPSTSDPIDSMFLHAPSTRLMVKVTMDRLDRVVPDLRTFDRRVMTVRDPRDVIVSSLLFRPLTRSSVNRAEPSAVHEFIAALEEKEAEPSSHSVRGLFTLAHSLGIGRPPYQELSRVLDRQLELLAAGLVHVVRYEEFINDELQDLSKYVGFEVGNAAAGNESWIGHITRSQSSGEFTRWFLEEDLDFFNDLYAEHLRTFKYALDASLEPDQKIDPATSSQYVRSRYVDRRARFLQDPDVEWSPRHVDSPEALSRLIEKAHDGSRESSLRLAKVLLSGQLGPPDPVGALEWTRYAAQAGSPWGRQMTIDLLHQLEPDDPALRRELRGWQFESAAVEAAGRLPPPRSMPRRLASGLAYLVRHPRKGLPKVGSLLSRGMARYRRR